VGGPVNIMLSETKSRVKCIHKIICSLFGGQTRDARDFNIKISTTFNYNNNVFFSYTGLHAGTAGG